MRRRDISLDFTSLLDITLILLFFFIMFSSFDFDKAKAELAQEQSLAKQAEQAAVDKANEYQEKIDMAIELDEKDGKELYAFIEKYKSNKCIKIILSIENLSHWNLTIKDGNEIISVLNENDSIEASISNIIESAREENDEIVLCDFVYDGNQAGSYSLYLRITEVLRSIDRFYWAETDVSTTETK